MSNAIVVNKVNKVYELYDSPAQRLRQVFSFGGRKYYREHQALSDVSFIVKRGEAFGILGRNGAGKSTLLQVISGILSPTSGETKVNGKVAALLELGSGFNPEFSGKDNVYLNASVLGFSKSEIASKYPQIVEFSGIGAFIEHPVKTYSSGMILRLAISVLLHMEPEILIVDEALAVGDVSFVGKCLEKIAAYVKNGGTLLFVSHDVNMIRNLTSRSIVLSRGQVVFSGDSKEATSYYLQSFREKSFGSLVEEVFFAEGFDGVLGPAYSEQGTEVVLHPGERVKFSIKIDLSTTHKDSHLSVSGYNSLGILTFGFVAPIEQSKVIDGSVVVEMEPFYASPGTYTLNFSITDSKNERVFAWRKNALSITVVGLTGSYLYLQPWRLLNE